MKKNIYIILITTIKFIKSIFYYINFWNIWNLFIKDIAIIYKCFYIENFLKNLHLL